MVSHVSIDRSLGTVGRAVAARDKHGFGATRRWLSLPAMALLVAGCHKSSTGPNPETTGALIVTIEAPPGTTSLAVVSGPNDYAVFVTGVDTLIGLTAGSYVLSDAAATAQDPIVTGFYAPTVIGSPVNVANADTTRMSATFAVLPGTGRLWVGSSNGGSATAAGYTSTQLTTGTAAGTALTVGGTYIVFDSASNLWIADSAGNRIFEYLAASIGATGSPTAPVTVTSSALSGPDGITFDRQSDLWVANAGTNTIVEFTATQLAAGGAQAPAKTMRTNQLNKPGRIAFDAYGNLWVPNAGSNTVVAFSPTALTVGDTISPTIALSSNGGSLNGPTGVAFDQQGDLWVTNRTGNTVVEFANAQQTASGSPVPVITFSVPPANGALTALAFDNSGDLWAVSASSASVVEYTAPQISSGVATAPAYSATVASGPLSLAFDPPPNGLPIVGPQMSRIRTAPDVRTGTIRMPRGMAAIR